MAMLYCCSYVYMLRVPSELLPVRFTGSAFTKIRESEHHAAFQCGDSELRLVLRRRKNAQSGAIIRRDCACHLARELCPVHTIAPWICSFALGALVFEGISPAVATRRLRKHLDAAGVSDSKCYSLHSFRRGAAQDLVAAKCTLAFLLLAGGWSSRACFEYLQPSELNLKGALNLIMNDSDSDCD